MGETYSRISQASIAIIKVSIDGEDKYLLQWNKKWNNYNFISGKVEEDLDGGSFERCVIREIEEELPPLRYVADFTVSEILPGFMEMISFSKRTLQTTLYRFKLYQLFFTKPLQEYETLWTKDRENRWFSKEELLRGDMVASFPIPDVISQIPQGLDSLPLSTP